MPSRRAPAAPCRSSLPPVPPDHAQHARLSPIDLAALSSTLPGGRPVRSLGPVSTARRAATTLLRPTRRENSYEDPTEWSPADWNYCPQCWLMSHSATAVLRYLGSDIGVGPRGNVAQRIGADMGASGPIWLVVIAVIVGLVTLDYLVNVRRPHTPTLREAAVWSAVYVAIAIAFGIGVWGFGGLSMSVEYFACYVSNEALSIDNLLVFLYLVGCFAVPRIAQQKVLLFGIVFALVARTGFIFIGAAFIRIFDWAFYLFGIVLLIMAGNLAKR